VIAGGRWALRGGSSRLLAERAEAHQATLTLSFAPHAAGSILKGRRVLPGCGRAAVVPRLISHGCPVSGQRRLAPHEGSAFHADVSFDAGPNEFPFAADTVLACSRRVDRPSVSRFAKPVCRLLIGGQAGVRLSPRPAAQQPGQEAGATKEEHSCGCSRSERFGRIQRNSGRGAIWKTWPAPWCLSAAVLLSGGKTPPPCSLPPPASPCLSFAHALRLCTLAPSRPSHRQQLP
jgi:hypothetical protein